MESEEVLLHFGRELDRRIRQGIVIFAPIETARGTPLGVDFDGKNRITDDGDAQLIRFVDLFLKDAGRDRDGLGMRPDEIAIDPSGHYRLTPSRKIRSERFVDRFVL